MKKRIQKTSILSGAIIAFVFIVFSVQTSSANPVAEQLVSVNAEMGTAVNHFNIFDGKCGEGSTKAEKKTGTKAKAKTSEGKCGEGK